MPELNLSAGVTVASSSFIPTCRISANSSNIRHAQFHEDVDFNPEEQATALALPSRRMAPTTDIMNPFASEHDAQKDVSSESSTPLQNIKRKPVSRNERPGQIMQPREEGLSPIAENRSSHGFDAEASYGNDQRPYLREAVSVDSLQAQPPTETIEDVRSSLMGEHQDARVTENARPYPLQQPEQATTREQHDAESPNEVAPKRQHGFKEHAKAWAPECGWILVAVALFVALCVLLGEYDNKALPNWPMGLTLNTLIAFLATMCRSALIVPIGEGISQLKWNWFVAKKRPIKDLYIFDQASRGPWGSIRLIFRMKGR